MLGSMIVNYLPKYKKYQVYIEDKHTYMLVGYYDTLEEGYKGYKKRKEFYCIEDELVDILDNCKVVNE